MVVGLPGNKSPYSNRLTLVFQSLRMMYDYKLNLVVRTPRACPWESSVLTLVLEIVAIAVVSVFGMTFIAKSYDKIIAYVEKRWGEDVSFGVSCGIILTFLFITLAVIFC